jgi:hypothetical protein
MVNFVHINYFLFTLMGFFLGRLAMAIQYAIFKGMSKSKKKRSISEINSEYF